MRRIGKCPEDALARISGAQVDNPIPGSSEDHQYAKCRGFQTRRLRSRWGLNYSTARLIALLHFGEERK